MASVDLSSVTDTFLTKFEEHGGADHDHMGAIKAPEIYGREKEAALLLQTYERVVQSRQSQTVFVHGLSGHGKTALIDKFRETVCESGGLFCGGKYFQNMGFQEPHSAIVAAFSDLCDLVIQSDNFTEERRQQIKEDLGSDGVILKKLISNVSPFLEGSPDDSIEEIQTDAIIKLFRVACMHFLRAMASGNEPVVVFLDDIQWMDEGSKKLIQTYVSDMNLKNVMFILAYRDEEKECVRRGIFANVNMEAFIDVPVEKLSRDGVADMVSSMMNCPELDTSDEGEKIKELIGLVYQRTNGNPFHLIQFMDTIQLEGLLKFDADSESWIFCVQDIKRQIMVVTSVADLLLRKIQLLPKDEQESLKVASLLGYDFRESVLFQIVREERRYQSDESVATSTRSLSLGKAYQMGLVERSGDTCNFPHDKIQSAFLSMISDKEEMLLQRTIGETYLSLESDDSIYRAALHLNQTFNVMPSSEERVRLARINLQAANYASNRSAFDAAVEMLRHSLNILDNTEDEKWSKHFDLAFQITENLARLELVVGNLERCKVLSQEALARATSLDMKLNSLLISVECQLAGDGLTRTPVGALVPLGIRFPRRVRAHHVIRKFLAVRRSVRGKSDEDFLQLPLMEDKAKLTASRILLDICLYAGQQDQGLTLAYAYFVAFELTLKYGLCPHSPTFFMIFATAERHAKNYTQANRFASLGERLLDRMQSKSTECSAYVIWVSSLAHWTKPLADLWEPISKGVDSGFQTGDVTFLPIAMSVLFGLSFQIGYNLQYFTGFMQKHYDRLCELSENYSVLFHVEPCFQMVLNLQNEASDWIDLTILSGSVMNEETYFRMAAQLKNPLAAAVAYTCKSFLYLNFGFTELSVNAYEKMNNLPPHFHNVFTAPSWYYNGALTYYDHYRQTGKRKHFRKARKWRRYLEKIQARGSPNARYVSLLQAEEKSFQKNLDVTALLSAYDAAIVDAVNANMVQREALSNERAGFALVERKMYTEARTYFDRALELYRDGWGAFAKHDWLQEKSATLLSSVDVSSGVSSPQIIGDILVLGE